MMKNILLSVRVTVRPFERCTLPLTHGQFLQKVLFDTLGSTGKELHDRKEYRPFSVWGISLPPSTKIKDHAYQLEPFHSGYFDVVFFDEELINIAASRWKKLERGVLRIGSCAFKVTKISLMYKGTQFFGHNRDAQTLDIALKSPYHIVGEDGFGELLEVGQVRLANILETPRKAYNHISGSEMSRETLLEKCNALTLKKDRSKLVHIRFPYYKNGKQIIKKGHKGKLVFQGTMDSQLIDLVKLSNFVGVGHGRTYGLGKVYARVR